MTAYNGQAITYDQIGNPLTYYNGTTFTWYRGRKLETATTADGTAVSYLYNDSGIRTRKTVNGVATDYFLDGSKIVAEKTGDNTIWYYYDGDGTREAIEYNGNIYYYYYNAQGDVIGLFNNNLTIAVEYTYDSWGNVVSITGPRASTLGQDNPFRYRGYYYDKETNLYYLNARYYDANTGRFINADGYFDTQTGVLSHNMYAYCNNNPVNMSDSTGTGPITFLLAVGGILLISAATALAINYAKHVLTGRDMKYPEFKDTAQEVVGRKSEIVDAASKINGFGDNLNNAINRKKQHSMNVVNAAYAKSKSQKFIAKSVDTGFFKSDQIYSNYCSSLSDTMYQSLELYGPCNIRGKSWDMLTEYEQQRVIELAPDWDKRYVYYALNDGKETAIDMIP